MSALFVNGQASPLVQARRAAEQLSRQLNKAHPDANAMSEALYTLKKAVLDVLDGAQWRENKPEVESTEAVTSPQID